MKEVTEKAKCSNKSNFLLELKIVSKIKTGEDEIANTFNNFFANIGPFLAKKNSNLHRCCLKVF